MILVGNDIVALDHRAGRSRQPVFYSKIITPGEKELYMAAEFPRLPFEHFVWLCWAVKEAAFKCINRANPGELFWGPRITITELAPLSAFPGEDCLDTGGQPGRRDSYSALARFGTHRLQAWAIVGDEYIMAVSLAGETFSRERFSEVRWGIRRIGSEEQTRQSAEVRSFVLEKLGELLPGQALTVQKTPAGHPVILNGSQPLDLGLSFSHHADWVSYAFLLPSIAVSSQPGQ